MSREFKKSITVFKTPSWGILGMAFLTMLVAKCFNYQDDLSWWAVTAPLWGPFALGIVFVALFYICMFGAFLAIGVIAVVLTIGELCNECVRTVFKKIFSKKGN